MKNKKLEERVPAGKGVQGFVVSIALLLALQFVLNEISSPIGISLKEYNRELHKIDSTYNARHNSLIEDYRSKVDSLDYLLRK